MTLVDWRRLYAANRASIAAARGGAFPDRIPAPGAPGRPQRAGPRLLEADLQRSIGPLPADPAPGGTWERRAHSGPTGERTYFVYTPPNVRVGDAAPLLVLLHGCTQTAGTFAASTRMNAAADRHGFVVAYPEQAQACNPQRCWNWFLPAH